MYKRQEENIRKKVEKVSSMEKIKTNVEKETGDRIRNLDLAGVKVDEDFKRYYPYDTLASRVLGFTGGDNQGIIGLEVKYEEVLKGTNGTILTVTDARGVELEKVEMCIRDSYMGADGSVQKGIVKANDGKYYHMDETTGKLVRKAGWIEVGDKK